jgi:transketolase
MPEFFLIPTSEFERVRNAAPSDLAVIADMCRANTLMTVKRAGSGHLGSSLSAMDVFTYLYHEELNTVRVGYDSPDRDVFYSSKGHDVPGQYAVLHSLGTLSAEVFIGLRRDGGTPGHPDVCVEGIEANTGSLGMGISKGKGFAWAKKHSGHGGRVIVLTGDGELQEGQNYEAFHTAVAQGITNLTVVVDCNKLQSDKLCKEICDLGDMRAKLLAFGWHVSECDGHDYAALRAAFHEMDEITDRPKMLIAHTIKGRGISFMEHPRALEVDKGIYRWHSGAPDDASYDLAYEEIVTRIQQLLQSAGIAALQLQPVPAAAANPAPTKEFVVDAYGKKLYDLMQTHPKLVVLDADLAIDARLRDVENLIPDRFIQNGIAEQDMASMAGGLALAGYLPVVNSFAAFLAARANEQIYANNTERTKIIYGCNYAGLLPAGPGHSHQSVRDISLLNSLPDIVIFQPCNGRETELGLDFLVDRHPGSSAIRLFLGPCPREIALPAEYHVQLGRGAVLKPGRAAWFIAYGPVLLAEALTAAEQLEDVGVLNLPWLNQVDMEWLASVVGDAQHLFVLEDHAPAGGLASAILLEAHRTGRLCDRRVHQHAVHGVPECGTPREALRKHGLDADSLVQSVEQSLGLQRVGSASGG